MPPRMRTQSAGRPVAKLRRGGIGKRVGRGGRGRRPRGGCSYKEFLACNPKEYDGKGGAVVLTRWIKKMESVQDMSGCSIDQKVKYTAGLFMEKFCPSHEMQKFQELARLVPHLLTPESRKIKRNGSIKKVKKRGNVGEPSKDKNGRDDNKRTRTGNAFTSTVNPVGRENMGTWPKCTTGNSYHAPGGPCRTCFSCDCQGHLAKDCRGVPRNVNPVNARNLTVKACYECGGADHVKSAYPKLNRVQGPGENHTNQVAANNGGLGRRNQGNQARGRTFMLGAEEARQDSNIVTVTHRAQRNSFRYEIEIASGQLVEIDKVIKGCKLEIEGHVFDIDLITFRHRSFDMIIGTDWLSNHKVEIICHKKVVRIPLLDGKVLRVREKLEEKMRQLKSAKAKEKEQEDIVVVRDFPEVFLDDLSGLPPVREIELILRVVQVAKSPYHLAPFELKLSGQLKEL
ncbi:putative reverse transcriptase domain-containing protein [Tanacetum coccineum]